MTNNKITAYLLYAVGEIILVVIGILIAVSIDDWNNNRIQKIAEKKYFNNLIKDLEDDANSLEIMTNVSGNKALAASKIRSRINQDTIGPIHDLIRDLQTLIFVNEFNPHQSTYREMSSTGSFSGIENEDLKLGLLGLYENYAQIKLGQDHVRNDYEIFLGNLETHIDMGKYYNLSQSDIATVNLVLDSAYIKSNEVALKNDLKNLLNDNIFRNNIFLIELNYKYLGPYYQQTRNRTREIIENIKQEISNI